MHGSLAACGDMPESRMAFEYSNEKCSGYHWDLFYKFSPCFLGNFIECGRQSDNCFDMRNPRNSGVFRTFGNRNLSIIVKMYQNYNILSKLLAKNVEDIYNASYNKSVF